MNSLELRAFLERSSCVFDYRGSDWRKRTDRENVSIVERETNQSSSFVFEVNFQFLLFFFGVFFDRHFCSFIVFKHDSILFLQLKNAKKIKASIKRTGNELRPIHFQLREFDRCNTQRFLEFVSRSLPSFRSDEIHCLPSFCATN